MTSQPPASTQETHRSVELTKIGAQRFKATNARGGETYFGSGGEDPDFTPIEMLLAALAGCGAIEVDLIAGRRATAETFRATASGDKIRDDDGNHLVNLSVTFDVAFPAGEAGDAAREVMPRTLEQVRERLCAVSRTVALGEPVSFDQT